jgi:hypothetical protein
MALAQSSIFWLMTEPQFSVDSVLDEKLFLQPEDNYESDE